MVRINLMLALFLLSGCTHTQEIFRCECDCGKNKLECSSNVKKVELEGN